MNISIKSLNTICAAAVAAVFVFVGTAWSAPKQVTVPTGTSILIRTLDAVSGKSAAGSRFAGKLEGDLVADGVVIAPSGSTVYGQIETAKTTRALAGSSNVSVRLTEIMINNQRVPIITSSAGVKSDNKAKGTVKKTGLGAAVGGLAGGSKGAKIGAGAGLGLSALGGRQSVGFEKGSLLEFRLSQPLKVNKPKG